MTETRYDPEPCTIINFRGWTGLASLSTTFCFFKDNPNECFANPGLDCIGHRLLGTGDYPPMEKTDLAEALEGSGE